MPFTSPAPPMTEDQGALHARIKKEAEDAYLGWLHNDQIERGYSPTDVQFYCVRSRAWQEIRRCMKGIPTHEKLDILHEHWDKYYGGPDCFAEIQVGNYLGALRRGGQLDSHNRIRKYI